MEKQHITTEQQTEGDTMMRTETTLTEGHQRNLQITFNLWSTLGLVYSITATPFGMISYLSFTLILGGSPFFIYCYIVAVTFNIILCVALAEVSAIYPHPSGHIYWVGKTAPKGWEKSLSYWTGTLTSAAWFFWNAGVHLLTGQIIMAVVTVLHPSYTTQPWHVLLVAFAQALLSIAWNVPLFKALPYALKAMVVITNASVLLISISLLVRAHPKQTSGSVWAEVVNESGWSSNGVVFFLGLLPGATAINGFDSASHMVEEMSDPARQVAQVMIGNSVLSALSGFYMIVVCAYCVTNVQNLLTPVGGVTIIQIFQDSLNSEALFTLASTLYIIITIVAAVATATTTSRVFWSFSEHKGLPFHKWISTISRTNLWEVPMNAVITVSVLSCIILLLNLGPSFLLATLFTAADVCFYASYIITLGCFLQRKWTRGLPPHYCNLGGRMGDIIGVTSIVWSIFVSVWLFFPDYRPVTSTGMNYSVALVGIVVAIFSVDWFVRGRRQYFIPSRLLV